MASSSDAYQKKKAAELLAEGFGRLDDKKTAWEDLHGLSQDDQSDVRWSAARAIRSVFGQVPNKDQAWTDLHRLAQDEESNVRLSAAHALKSVFDHIPDKKQAWADLNRLAQDENSSVRWNAARAMKSVFGQVSDKDQAWEDLHRLSRDEKSDVRWGVIEALGSIFDQVPDKGKAWRILHRLSYDAECDVRSIAADALRWVFSQVPDKDQAWADLHRLSQDEKSDVRLIATDALRSVFDRVPDKDQAWADLHRLSQDEKSNVRSSAASSLRSVFGQVPHRDKAWADLHRLSKDENCVVRSKAAGAIGSVFNQIPNKNQAWMDLHRLAQDDESNVRLSTSQALGSAFSQVPDKDQAWMDLHQLALDENNSVRSSAAEAFGSAFSQVPNKEQAWADLRRLAQDKERDVRCTSYHSMGRISIWKAAESDDKLRMHLEEAIEFFRKSSEESLYTYTNPAAFCLPFYQSLHSLLFTEVPKECEVQKYLAEAKMAIKASESREVLLEAVNNLSKALQEVRAYSVDDILLRRRDLKSYTKYCLQTAECLREARSKAPLASKVVDYTLVEKSIPVLDQKIKALFKDVEATAGDLCKSTRGTNLEAFGRDVYESTRGLNEVESWIAADRYLEEIVPLLKGHCNRLPIEAQACLRVLVDSQDSASLEQRFDTLKSVLLASLVQGENDDRLVKELKELLDLHLQNIEFAILNLNTSSGNARKDLYNLKNQIDRLQKEIESQGLAKKELAEALDEKDQAMIDRLEKMREKMLRAVRETTQLNASKRDVETILKELDNQDLLKKRDALGIIADLSSLAGMALALFL